MEVLTTLTAGALLGAGLHLILRRDVFSVFLGLVLASHAVNLVLFVSGGLTRGEPPILEKAGRAEYEVGGEIAEPLPQALILTAIVIGLGVQSFLLVLVYRLIETVGTTDLDAMRRTEPGAPEEEAPEVPSDEETDGEEEDR